jgi:hypothetical protein
MFSMASISASAYTADEMDALVSRATDIIFGDGYESGPEYTEASVEAVFNALNAFSSAIKAATEDDVVTEEELSIINGLFDELSAACDAAILKTTIKVTPTSKSFKAKDLKKKAKTFNLKAKVSSGAKASFKKSSGNSKISVTKAGKVTVKKGLKKGSYKVKVKVSVPKTTVNGTPAEAKTKTVTVTVKVK